MKASCWKKRFGSTATTGPVNSHPPTRKMHPRRPFRSRENQRTEVQFRWANETKSAWVMSDWSACPCVSVTLKTWFFFFFLVNYILVNTGLIAECTYIYICRRSSFTHTHTQEEKLTQVYAAIAVRLLSLIAACCMHTLLERACTLILHLMTGD